jgi:hypothetical protein
VSKRQGSAGETVGLVNRHVPLFEMGYPPFVVPDLNVKICRQFFGSEQRF